MQNETEKIIEEYISKSPEAIREFMVNGDWKNNTNIIADRFKFTEENKNDLINEIIFVLIGMEPKSDFVENITRELEIDSNMAGWVAEDVNKNIFSQVEKEIDEMWKTGDSAQGEEKAPPQNNIGTDFEQIILNQAKAMQPARNALASEAGEPARSAEEKKVIHNYIGENDPYREPVE